MLLLDANVLIWWMNGDPRLGTKAKQILESSDAELIISLITLFEIELKCKVKKLKIKEPINNFLETFAIEVYRPFAGELMPMLKVDFNHSDPFDCALIGLGRLKGWTVMTSDKRLLEVSAGQVTMIDTRE